MLLSRQECLATSTISTLTPTRISKRLLLVAPVQDQQIASMKQQEMVVVEGESVVQLQWGLVIVVVGVGGVVGLSRAFLKSLVLLVAGEVVSLEGEELLAKLGELKVILANKEPLQPLAISQVVVLAGGQVEEVVVLRLNVDKEVDRQAGAEAGVAVVEEDRLAGGRSSAIGVSQSTTTLECLMQSSSRGRPP